jgi:hypothetical protein
MAMILPSLEAYRAIGALGPGVDWLRRMTPSVITQG